MKNILKALCVSVSFNILPIVWSLGHDKEMIIYTLVYAVANIIALTLVQLMPFDGGNALKDMLDD